MKTSPIKFGIGLDIGSYSSRSYWDSKAKAASEKMDAFQGMSLEEVLKKPFPGNSKSGLSRTPLDVLQGVAVLNGPGKYASDSALYDFLGYELDDTLALLKNKGLIECHDGEESEAGGFCLTYGYPDHWRLTDQGQKLVQGNAPDLKTARIQITERILLAPKMDGKNLLDLLRGIKRNGNKYEAGWSTDKAYQGGAEQLNALGLIYEARKSPYEYRLTPLGKQLSSRLTWQIRLAKLKAVFNL